MSIFVDTSVWSLAFRRDAPPDTPQVSELHRALDAGQTLSTGLILQELLQGFSKPKAHQQIIEYFSAIPLLIPDRDDHIRAAEVRNKCRQKGIQIGTIDALLAQLCISHELMLLTTDKDFDFLAKVTDLSIWRAMRD